MKFDSEVWGWGQGCESRAVENTLEVSFRSQDMELVGSELSEIGIH